MRVQYPRLSVLGGMGIGWLAAWGPATAVPAELPVTCAASACGSVNSFVTSGSASVGTNGNTLTVTQTSNSAIMNWKSFNISKDGTVNFVQPGTDSIALNRIYQNDPSQIFGALNSNGQVYLLNQNGVVFGTGATINVAGLVASSLDMTPAALANGIAGAALSSSPAFTQYKDASGNVLPSGDVTVQAGATITTARQSSTGTVYLFAPNVTNEGSISTPGGQTLLAAGSPIYLTTSTSSDLRGLLVEVGTGGTVTNGDAGNAGVTDPAQLVGQIIAERGNVTLAGLAVNQLGRVSATTSVKLNGSIRLQARDGASVSTNGVTAALSANHGGDLELGQNSRTEVALDTSGATAVDSLAQPVSQVTLSGNRIVMEKGAQIVAHHGDVSAVAESNTAEDPSTFSAGASSDSRIYLAPGALIDVSGVNVDAPMSANTLNVELRSTELADSPAQQGGVLQGQTVTIDTRLYGTRADGSTWVGSPIANLSGWLGAVPRDVNERSLTGGTVSLRSSGDTLLATGSKIDLSGGSITYAGGFIDTTSLLGADGKVYDIGSADRDRSYSAILAVSGVTVKDARWGTSRTYLTYGSRGHYEQGYTEGKDAGSLAVTGENIVLDGTVQADVQVDRYQRKVPTAIPDGSLYRHYDEAPLSAQLTIGNTSSIVKGGAFNGSDYQTGNVSVVAADTAPVLGSGFDPWNDALPAASGDSVVLNSKLFGVDGIGRLTVRANGTFMVEGGVALGLPAFGQLNVQAGTVDVEGSVVAHSGSLKLASAITATTNPLAGGLTLGNNGLIDVSGMWVNDLSSANGGMVGSAPLAVNGGSVALSAAQNSLALQSGSVIDASGGAQVTAAGQLKAGSGGSISLSTSPEALYGTSTQLVLDGQLRAFALFNGGTLSLTADAFCVAMLASDCADQSDAGLILVNPYSFQRGGFSSYALTSDQGGVEVAAGTQLTVFQHNLILDADAFAHVTGANLNDIAGVGTLDDATRQAANLALSSNISLPNGETYRSSNFADASSLVIGTGASITADTGASISLSSNSRLLVDGKIDAPAGSIALTLNNGLALDANATDVYLADQGIWLGDHASLLATGATRLLTSDAGRISGSVLGGGSVTLIAQRGHILTSSGSVVDVSGTAADVDVATDAEGHYARRSIGSAGGSISLTASEAIVVGGTIKGASGAPGSVAGGTLGITLDPTLRLDPGQNLPDMRVDLLPSMGRVIDVTQQGGGQEFANATLDAAYQGRALIGADQVTSGGFDALQLNARTFQSSAGNVTSTHQGSVLLSGNVDLTLGRSLSINAASLASDGGQASVSAPYIAFGNTDTQYQGLAAATAGSGQLQLDAQLLDVKGSSALQGFGAATLESRGDLRLIGVQNLGGSAVTGALQTAGDLTLSANQIYPTTLTKFALSAGSGGNGTLTLTRPSAATSADIYSAGGSVSLTAPHIVQQGTLRAPFGTLTFNSPDIDLAAGSVTSTSGAGLDVLFGQTQGGFDWVYTLSGGWTLVYNPQNLTLPAQKITLNGDNVRIDSGATVDLRGGGDLLAYEFVNGVKGTRDLLSAAVSPTSFAIIPASSLAATPYDPALSADSNIGPATSVYLSGYGNLPAGNYVILPARYALLPGAYLVTPVSGYQDITAGTSFTRLDGSTVISGYLETTGTSLADARTSGFAIMSSAAVRARAQYTLTNANDFFLAEAANAGIVASRLPRDAGTLALVANDTLQLNGSVLAGADTGGRGAAVDIASNAITIAPGGSAGGASGLVLDVDQLNSLGVESLLIGGTRSDTLGGVAVTTTAASVEVADGANLSAPELLLVASSNLDIDAGATLSGTSSTTLTPRDITVAGNGALVRVSGGDLVDVSRTGSTGTSGALTIAQGAALNAAGGAISLDTSNAATVQGTISADGGALSLAGNQISVGNVTGVSGFVLDPSQFAGADLKTLVLHSRGAIDFYGDAALSGTNITLAAQQLRGFGGDAAVSASGTLQLGGVSDASGVVANSTAGGSVALGGRNVEFMGGNLALSGFAASSVTAGDDIDNAADGTVTVNGDLRVTAQRWSVGSGSDLTVSATGALDYGSNGTASSLAAVTGLGGSLTLNGATVDIAGRITLPSGALALNSTAAGGGGVHLQSGAIIDLSGMDTVFNGQSVGSAGGQFAATASSGDIVQDSGSGVDVSGAGAARAGSVAFTAAGGNVTLAGSLAGHAAAATGAGNFSIDAQAMPTLDTLNALLGAGGFSGTVNLRQRGTGDLVLSAGQTLSAARVALVADAGSIDIEGAIRAHDVAGGRIDLSASNGMTINGTLDARASGSAERNGRIDLAVENGGLAVGTTAVIATLAPNAAAGSAADGSIQLRLPQSALLSGQVALNGDWSSAGPVTVEGFRVYTSTSGILDYSDTLADPGNPYYADAASFAAAAVGLQGSLNTAGIASLDVVPGIEIQSAGDLELDSDWDLSQWRFNGLPGVLTLRAAGNITFNASLSDGFTGTTGYDAFRLTATDKSWSYHLTAGADLSSAGIGAVLATNQLAANSGNLVVAAGDPTTSDGYHMIRTGTGSIDVNAGRNVQLGNSGAMIYTAGLAQTGQDYGGDDSTQLGALEYPANGGDISIHAGQDVVGAAGDQLVTDWLWRIGNVDLNASQQRSTAWSVNFAQFHQNVATLGGGDVTVTAGQDIRDLSASAPTIGRQTGGINPGSSALSINGGGTVTVDAGANIRGGEFYSGRGAIDLNAGQSILASTTTKLAPVIALGDASANLSARESLYLGSVLTPTMLHQGSSQNISFGGESYFSTYGADSSVSLVSLAGDVHVVDNALALSRGWATLSGLSAGFNLYPAQVKVLALRGDVDLDGSMTLFPAANGYLSLHAYDDVNIASNAGIIVSDADPSLLPGITNPTAIGDTALSAFRSNLASFHAATPVRLVDAGNGTLRYSDIVAQTGDITQLGQGQSQTLQFGGPLAVYAGRDIVDLGVVAQNLVNADVTSVVAGRDISYSAGRSSFGGIGPNYQSITVDGPGWLSLTAGRNINLQNSLGISTRGSLANPALPEQGASISVLVGINGQQPDYSAFELAYVHDSQVYAAELITYITQITGVAPANYAAAVATFEALALQKQVPFLQQVLFAELRTSGRYAASPDPKQHDDYSQGFKALEAMFPGSNPDLGAGATNPYAGNLDLYFSRIYTLAGGDISLLAPGGEINAGLSSAPASFGISKQPSQLGIVAQTTGDLNILAYGDLAVNESRVFAADGGNILVWSTEGDIDAGRGAKTAISAALPTISVDNFGIIRVSYPASLTGSGIQAIATSAGVTAGDVDLYAPHGVVNAGDAGIVAGNLTIGATAVLGADNIKVSGVAVGVPVDAGGLGASLQGVSSAANSATGSTTAGLDTTGGGSQREAPMATQALSWLEVFVLGLGEEDCKQDDLDCLKRQKH